MVNPLELSEEQIKALEKLNTVPTKAEEKKVRRKGLLDALVANSGAKTRAERRKLRSNLNRILRKEEKKRGAGTDPS